MATTNPVFQVLVTSGNQAPIAAGSKPDALANGQIGVFNFHTGLSVDGTVLPDTQDIYLAVGINRTSGGVAVAEDIQRSAGQVLQIRNSKTYDVKAYVDEVQKVVELSGFTARCETDYSLKIEFRNQRSYLQNGYNQFAKTFNFFTGCCATPACDDCPNNISSPIELAQGLADNINSDPDKLVIASLFAWKIGTTVTAGASANGNLTVTVGTTAYTVPVLSGDSATVVASKIAAAINTQANSPYRASNLLGVLSVYPTTSAVTNTDTFALTSAGGTSVAVGSTTTATKTNITDSTAFSAANAGAGVSLRITGVLQARSTINGSIFSNYYGTGLDFLVSFTQPSYSSSDLGLGLCNGKITTITNVQYPEGKGFDLQELEYEAGGWNGKPGPYRTSSVLGLQKGAIEYFSSASGNYTQLVLEYDQFSVGGWLEYLNNLRTIIAIPCADTATLTGLVTILDAIFINRFSPKSDDVSTMDCTNTSTNTLTLAADGISSLT